MFWQVVEQFFSHADARNNPARVVITWKNIIGKENVQRALHSINKRQTAMMVQKYSEKATKAISSSPKKQKRSKSKAVENI